MKKYATEIPLKVIQYVYRVRNMLYVKYWYYLLGHPKGHFVKGNPYSNKIWKYGWFYAGSAWEIEQGKEPSLDKRVYRDWSKGFTWSNKLFIRFGLILLMI
ncbi:hypothetical protein L484_003765 [Morus notabilis]|uniref:Uncharacterized protein n=1 Tax=Morus notabilis TaxID=981085 RepID=W9S4B1_9ROSA|nr:hypothetical protein L484_003765 [Morus notabilis]